MSIQRKLQNLDQELIRLMKERIGLLTNADILPTETQVETVKPLLEQAGISEALWQTIVMGCTAAVPETQPQGAKTHARKVTLVGGHGMMGRFFKERLIQAQHDVTVLERDDWDNAQQLLADADLVLVCVPLKATVDVIAKITPYLSADTAIADIASIKTPVVEAMLAHHAGPAMGLHPMFGPGVHTFAAQKVVVCHGRRYDAFRWLLDIIEHEGGQLITCSAEEHDEMMIAVQAIRHFSTLSLGVFLAKEGVDLNRALELATPIYRMEVNLISRLLAQDVSLYTDIMTLSDARCDALHRLADTFADMADLLSRKDTRALAAQVAAARQAFCKNPDQIMQETNYLISTVSTFVAAKDRENQAQYACA